MISCARAVVIGDYLSFDSLLPRLMTGVIDVGSYDHAALYPSPKNGRGCPQGGRGPMPLTRAKTLRKNMTQAEQKLWFHLRAKRFMGVKFKRQKPIGGYIVDFVAVEAKLIIEVDGSQHLEAQEYDAERTRYLEGCGFRVLRFWNNECLGDINDVLRRIAAVLPSPALRAPSPIFGRGNIEHSN